MCQSKFELNKLEIMALEILKHSYGANLKIDDEYVDHLTPELAAQLAAQLITECSMYTMLDEGGMLTEEVDE
jgi:hypothetical protein